MSEKEHYESEKEHYEAEGAYYSGDESSSMYGSAVGEWIVNVVGCSLGKALAKAAILVLTGLFLGLGFWVAQSLVSAISNFLFPMMLF